jgi:hypothetical protein
MTESRARELIDFANLVRGERRKWGETHLLAPSALLDFQKLTDEAFRALRREHFGPADLIEELKLRRNLKAKTHKAL